MTDLTCAFDTNILVYAEGVNGPERADCANALLEVLAPVETFLAVQTLGELFAVLVRKDRCSPSEAEARIEPWRRNYGVVSTSRSLFESATALAARSGYQIWDAIILAAAAEAECALLLSEDMQDGFVYRGVTVANPFAERIHPLLASLMDSLTPSRPAGAPE